MNERDIFVEALGIENLGDRSSFLDKACENKPALRERVQFLLETHANAGEFLDQPIADLVGVLDNNAGQVVAPRTSSIPEEPIPDQIGPYLILRKVGQGGMGIVYQARHSKLNKVVALKVLPCKSTSHSHAKVRFEREMWAAGILNHANLVQALDAGEIGDYHFLAMEFIEGITLSQLIRQDGPMEVANACEVIRQAALGLQAIHEHGMIHRDVKPSNLMLTQQGIVKLFDLGVALFQGVKNFSDRDLTRTGQLIGTLEYLAPEQSENSHDIDIRADIYSLGATFYTLLVGETIFSDRNLDTPVQQLRATLSETPSSLKDRRPEVPMILAELVESMLAKDPKIRPSTPGQVASILKPFTSGHELTSDYRFPSIAEGDTKLINRDSTTHPDSELVPNPSSFELRRLTILTTLFGGVACILLAWSIGTNLGYWPGSKKLQPQSMDLNVERETNHYQRSLEAAQWAMSWGAFIRIEEGNYRQLPEKGLVRLEGADYYDEIPDHPFTLLGIRQGFQLHRLANAEEIEKINGVATLEELDIHAGMTDAALSKLDNLPQLKMLALSHTEGRKVTDASIPYLARFPNLELLSLCRSRVTAEGIEQLTRIPEMQRLKGLRLLDVVREDYPLRCISNLSNIEYLDLGLCQFTTRGLNYLRDLPIKRLVLSRSAADNEAIKAIVQIKTLEKLELRKTKVTFAGAKRLSELPRLRFLDLREIEFIESEVETLKEILPDCEIISGYE